LAIKAKDRPEILAVSRVIKKHEGLKIPFEKLTGKDIRQFCAELNIEANEIWNCGRINIHKENLLKAGLQSRDSMSVMRTLFRAIYKVVGTKRGNLFLGESHDKVQRLYRRLGFNFSSYGEEKPYFETLNLQATYMEIDKMGQIPWLHR